MKKLTFSLLACVSVAGSALAGHEMRDYKADKNPPVPCFKDQELQLDLFGLYGWTTQSGNGDGFGGGLGVNYFFTKNLGIGVDGSLRDAGVHGSSGHNDLWTATANFIARFPLELGSTCIAPYVLAGGGVQTDGSTNGVVDVGGGLEWRVTPKFGIFTEGRYFFAGSEDQVQARLGARIVF